MTEGKKIDGDETFEMLVFRLGNGCFGIPASQIDSIEEKLIAEKAEPIDVMLGFREKLEFQSPRVFITKFNHKYIVIDSLIGLMSVRYRDVKTMPLSVKKSRMHDFIWGVASIAQLDEPVLLIDLQPAN